MYSSNYYSQGNGQVNYLNKKLINVIKKILYKNKNWDSQLIYGLWENKISYTISVWGEPFQLVYGPEVVLPIQL